MLCSICGHENVVLAKNCASCGAQFDNPISAGAGIATGGTSVPSAASNAYTPFLSKGVRLQSGSYAVGEVLGQGGFGITYKGGDLSLRRYVALKEFFPQGCNRQGNSVVPYGGLSAEDYTGVKAKFIEEARTLGRFNDPGIVKVYGVFEENNTAYMVMEFLEGKTLSKRMSEVGMMEEAEAIGIIKKVGAALSVVHNSGLIHRDIKPDNICLTDDGRVVLIDFGTARSFATGKTVKQTTMLTPGYAPLEQYGQQARFGSYTDIYALAATFYHALTGQVPPQATDRATGVDLKAPHELNPKVSRSVSQAIVWAMQVKADQRPQSVTTFLNALSATSVAPVIEPPQSSQTVTISAPPQGQEKWFHAVGGRQTGPMDRSALIGMIRHGVVSSSTLVWREGTVDWVPASQTDLADEFQNSPAPKRSLPNIPDPLERPDTPFDSFMASIPGWVWTLGLLLILLAGVGRIGVGIIRYQNGGTDFGQKLSADLLLAPQASDLVSADLHWGQGTYDPDSLTTRHDYYVGEARYKDGDVGDISLNVTERDWLYSPQRFTFRVTPVDFGSYLAGGIRGEVYQDLRNNGIYSKISSLTLSRQTRTSYSGTLFVGGDLRHPIGVSVTVTSFDENGRPATWTHALS